MEIKQKLIPSGNKTTRPGLYLNPSYITVHETDNTNKGADADAHARLQASGNNRTASWHYSVDDREIWQSIPDDEVSWACGDGRNGKGNRNSISIEICVNQDGDFEKAKANAAWLIRHLMSKHNIPISRVVQHNKWTGKNCPRNIRKGGWSAFLRLVTKTSASAPSSTKTVTKRTIKLTTPYMSGNDIKVVQKAVGATVDGVYGPKTTNLVTKLQKANGLVTDGIVGEKTWKVILKRRMLKLTNPQMVGEDVKEVQEKIKASSINGIYDSYTMNLVTKFQKAYGLSTDGIVGEKTWEAILLG